MITDTYLPLRLERVPAGAVLPIDRVQEHLMAAESTIDLAERTLLRPSGTP
jgi:hypothetical protein